MSDNTNTSTIDWNSPALGDAIAQGKTVATMDATPPAKAKRVSKAKTTTQTKRGKRAAAAAGIGDVAWAAVIDAVKAACGTEAKLVAVPNLFDADQCKALFARVQDELHTLPTTLRGKKALGFTWLVAEGDNVGLKATQKGAKALKVGWFVPGTGAAKGNKTVKVTPPVEPKGTLVTPPAAKALGARAQIEADAAAGIVPAAPDFTANTHKPYRAKLAAVVALVEAGDIAGLEGFVINPTSTSPKAIARYRDLAVIALKAAAAG